MKEDTDATDHLTHASAGDGVANNRNGRVAATICREANFFTCCLVATWLSSGIGRPKGTQFNDSITKTVGVDSRQLGVRNLPIVVKQLRPDRGSNSRPLDHESDALYRCATTPPSSGGVALCYVLPAGVDDVTFSHNGPISPWD